VCSMCCMCVTASVMAVMAEPARLLGNAGALQRLKLVAHDALSVLEFSGVLR
jgi:hypothetical protein